MRVHVAQLAVASHAPRWCCDRSMSQQQVDKLNAKFTGHLFISRTGSDSHMWSSETCIAFFEFLRGVLPEINLCSL